MIRRGVKPRTEPYPTEAALTSAAQDWIRNGRGGEVFHPIGTGSQKAGISDLIGVLAGRAFAIELKQPGNAPTPLQLKRMRDWRKAGALVGWATTIAELDAILDHAADPAWRADLAVPGG